MSQSEVYQILKKNKGKWFSPKELSEITNISHSSLICNINSLIKHYPRLIHQKNVKEGCGFPKRYIRYKEK